MNRPTSTRSYYRVAKCKAYHVLGSALVVSRDVCRRAAIVSLQKVMSDNMSIDKKEPTKDGSEESIASSPENEPDRSSAPQENQPAKRKGGRKPVSQIVPSLFTITLPLRDTNEDVCRLISHDALRSSDEASECINMAIDLRDFGRAQAKKSSGAGCLSRAPNRIHQAVGRDHPGPRVQLV